MVHVKILSFKQFGGNYYNISKFSLAFCSLFLFHRTAIFPEKFKHLFVCSLTNMIYAAEYYFAFKIFCSCSWNRHCHDLFTVGTYLLIIC